MTNEEDEIDLLELIASLLSQWVTILLTSVLVTVGAVYYAVSIAGPEYSASAKFVMKESSGSSLSGLAGLSNITGINLSGVNSADDSATFPDRIASRDFILRVMSSAGLKEDPVFNPPFDHSNLVTEILLAAGVSSPKVYSPEAETEQIVKSFNVHVGITTLKNGVLQLTTSHLLPDRASEVTNAVLDQLLVDARLRKLDESRATTEHMENELGRVQAELDAAAQDLAKYSLDNDVGALNRLGMASSRLATLRDEKANAEDYIAALDALLLSSNDKSFDSQTFIQIHPKSRDIFFRRLLRLPSSVSLWTVPAQGILEEASAVLLAQVTDLQIEIDEAEAEARIHSEAALEFAELERSLKVQQAIYETVLKQFEAQNFSDGFEAALSEVIERATPPMRPEKPRKTLIAALGLVLGLMIGSGIGLIRASRSGLAFTSGSLVAELGVDVSATRAGRVLPRFGRSYGAYWARACKYRALDLDEIAVSSDQREAKITLVVPTVRGKTALAVGLYVAHRRAEAGHATAVVDYSGTVTLNSGARDTDLRGFSIADLGSGTSIVVPKDQSQFMTAARSLDQLSERFERLIVVLPKVGEGAALAAAMIKDTSDALIIARPGHTFAAQLRRIKNILKQNSSTHASLVLE